MPHKKNYPLIIAHRGASAVAPENTFAAFSEAIREGADGLEFDVRISRDGVPVVFHDATLRRMTKRNLQIIDLQVAEIQQFDVGSWFNVKKPKFANPKFSAERIPTLAQFLEFLGDDYRGLLYLELKCNKAEMPTLVANVVKIIRNSKLLPQILIKCFQHEAIAEVKRIFPEARTVALFAPEVALILKKQSSIIVQAKEFMADEISLHYSMATTKLVASAKKQRLSTLIWTADHPVWVKRALEIGLTAIITNNPARLLAKRHEILSQTSILI